MPLNEPSSAYVGVRAYLAETGPHGTLISQQYDNHG